MFDVITIGGATRDFFFEFDSLSVKKNPKIPELKILEVPYGEKIVSDGAYYSHGGGAINSATSFSRLGLKAATLCNIGIDGSGKSILEHLKKEKVSTSLVTRDRHHHTGLSVLVLGKDAEHTGFLDRGANSHLKIDKWRPLGRTRWLYISSLTGDSAQLLPDIFRFAKKHKIKIAFNPGSEQLAKGYRSLKDFISITDVLLLNYQEAEELVASKTKKISKNEKELMAEVGKLGAKVAVVTEDGHGSHAICDGREYHQMAYSEKVLDTTGAGDAFGSTFVFGILKNFDISYCLRIAAINSASVVSKMGAGEGLLNYNRIRSSKWL